MLRNCRLFTKRKAAIYFEKEEKQKELNQQIKSLKENVSSLEKQIEEMKKQHGRFVECFVMFCRTGKVGYGK